MQLCKGLGTGVGADVALIDREEKGNWADLVKKIKGKDKEIHK